MLGEWYLPPGECQVILPIKKGTISISHLAFLSAQTRISQTPTLEVHTPNVRRPMLFVDQEVWLVLLRNLLISREPLYGVGE